MKKNTQMLVPGNSPYSFELSHLDQLAQGEKFKISVFDENNKHIGYIKFNDKSTYNHYATIEAKGDDFSIMADGRREYWKVESGVSRGYWLSTTPNAWLVTSEFWLARPFYFESDAIWEDKSGRPISCKGDPAIGKDVAVWNAGGFRALRVELQPVKEALKQTEAEAEVA
ncbi:hypothetical protein [Shewanella waksmanii]|uniref:hypothetical protein n=1 Tax=Shewanella waksmanii TaxID=213783 RepID=UPI003736D5F5